MRLGELLVERGVITPLQLDLALTAQPGSGRRLGEILVVLETVTAEQVRVALEEQQRDKSSYNKGS